MEVHKARVATFIPRVLLLKRNVYEIICLSTFDCFLNHQWRLILFYAKFHFPNFLSFFQLFTYGVLLIKEFSIDDPSLVGVNIAIGSDDNSITEQILFKFNDGPCHLFTVARFKVLHEVILVKLVIRDVRV